MFKYFLLFSFCTAYAVNENGSEDESENAPAASVAPVSSTSLPHIHLEVAAAPIFGAQALSTEELSIYQTAVASFYSHLNATVRMFSDRASKLPLCYDVIFTIGLGPKCAPHTQHLLLADGVTIVDF